MPRMPDGGIHRRVQLIKPHTCMITVHRRCAQTDRKVPPYHVRLECPAACSHAVAAHAAASAAAYVKAKTFSFVSQRVPKLWLGKPWFSRCNLLTLRGSE